ncbi:MAG: hypothetical protein EPO26_10485 [Chloroflexota bacterium]|nr:MAG: hypothetical protein EPO26_10485 [Chloroflexota bacterium]
MRGGYDVAKVSERVRIDETTAMGETTITGRGQVTLPARGLRSLDWHAGDRLLVQRLAPDVVVLVRRPESWTDTYAGRLTDVFGDHESVAEYLRGERASWSDD